MLVANKLKKGDTICIIAPSNPITEDRREPMDKAIEWLKSQWFNIIFSKNAFSRDQYNTSAGTPEERAADLNAAFSNKEIDMVWCVHGGDTANQILDLIDYENIKKNPKLFLGMSDIDVLHLAINEKTGLVTFNSADPKIRDNYSMGFEYSQKMFFDRLMDLNKKIEANSEWKVVRSGKVTGKILGCNLSSILKLAGTEYFPDFKDKILFLESYKIDPKKALWKLTQLKQLGVFDKIKGIIVGYAHGMEAEEYFDFDGKRIFFEDIILDLTKEYDFPIMKINEFGHCCDNCFLPIGADVEFDTDSKTLKFIGDFLK